MADSTLLDDYLSTEGPHGLQIGTGTGPKAGWLNTDVFASEHVMALDATQPFPIPDASFDYIFSEHMIEHVPYESGLAMLRECHRILRPGGVARIVTPSISFLMNLFSRDRTETEDRYVAWAMREFFPHIREPHPAFIFNNFVRAWGHTFIYDRPTMRMAMLDAGFASVDERRISQSQHAMLRNLEHIQRMPTGFLALESMIMEATKT